MTPYDFYPMTPSHRTLTIYLPLNIKCTLSKSNQTSYRKGALVQYLVTREITHTYRKQITLESSCFVHTASNFDDLILLCWYFLSRGSHVCMKYHPLFKQGKLPLVDFISE